MPQPPFPIIDAHTHVFHDRAYLEALLEKWQMKLVVINITGEAMFEAPMAARWEAMTALKETYPDRVALCTTFDPEPAAEPGFAERVVSELKEDLRRGASMVKVWKDLGLEAKDDDGAFIQVDDARFQPIWDVLAEEGIPVLAHIGEPRAAWLPLDPESPHFRYYRDHPAYHLYRRDDVPSWEHIMAARDRWLAQNPGLTVIGAHLGSMAHDVAAVAERLEAHPNFYVDTAERFGDLVAQPSEAVRAFFTSYADRILYGTDVIIEHAADEVSAEEREEERAGYDRLLASHWNYLSGDGAIEVQDKLPEPARAEALDLPRAVLESVYAKNAERLIAFGEAPVRR